MGAIGGSCGSCAGLAGAGSGAEMQGLPGACSVAVVTSEVVSVGLTLCVISQGSRPCHYWCALGSCLLA